MDGRKNTLTISQLSTILNISGPTLRFWENEFAGIFRPMRTPGGQRRYNSQHVEIIKKIIYLKNKGLKLAEIRDELGQGNVMTRADELDDNIKHLADRIAQSVRKEIYNFLNDTIKYDG